LKPYTSVCRRYSWLSYYFTIKKVNEKYSILSSVHHHVRMSDKDVKELMKCIFARMSVSIYQFNRVLEPFLRTKFIYIKGEHILNIFIEEIRVRITLRFPK
jgi:hypothetical protein